MLEGLRDKIYSLLQIARPWVPFTALNTAWRSLDKSAGSILDVGCGKGEPMSFVNRRKQFYTVAVDIFMPYLKQCKRDGIHDDYVHCDVRALPFKPNSFDSVWCMEVLEHLETVDGQKLLQAIEEIARYQVILTTPVGVSQQDERLLKDGDPYQIHKSGWQPEELRARGYSTRGSTIRQLAGKSRDISFPRLFKPFGYLLWVLAAPLAYFFPAWAGNMVCTKKLSETERYHKRPL